MSETKQSIDSAVLYALLRDTGNFSDEEIQRILSDVLEGKSVAEIVGIKKDTLEGAYSIACAYYSAMKFEDAATVFKSLCMYDDTNDKYWLGYGLALEKLNDFDNAAMSYAKVCDIQKNAYPKPLYLVASCYYKKKNYPAAKLLAQKALETDVQDQDSKQYRKFAQDLLESLPEEVQ